MKAYIAGGCFWCVTPIYNLKHPDEYNKEIELSGRIKR